jgi:hypothetical protein
MRRACKTKSGELRKFRFFLPISGARQKKISKKKNFFAAFKEKKKQPFSKAATPFTPKPPRTKKNKTNVGLG